MHENNFVKIKDTVDNVTGDQFYISKTFFPNYEHLFYLAKPADESEGAPFFDLKAVLRNIKMKISALKKNSLTDYE